jgi:hypothetical protein
MSSSNIRTVVEVLLAAACAYLAYIAYIAPINVTINYDAENSIQMRIEDKMVAHGAVLDSIWSRDFSTKATLGWLKEKDVFHYQDSGLAGRLGDAMPDATTHGNGESLDERKARLEGAIAENPLIADLRGRVRELQPPFQYIGKEVRVGVPSGNRPRSNVAYVAFGSEFDGRVVEIWNPMNDKRLTVFAQGAFLPTAAVTVDFQMNMRQAVDLFDRVEQTADAVAVILPPSTPAP